MASAVERWDLPVLGWSVQVDDLSTIDEVEAGERHDPFAVERGLEREVEAGERLEDGQSGHATPP